MIEQYNQGRQNHNINLISKFLGNHIKSYLLFMLEIEE